MPDIKIRSFEGSEFDAYAALPKGGNGAGLILLHEIFGITDSMRARCDAFAEKGYLVICPDLFWRHSPGLKFSENEPIDETRALNLCRTFDLDKAFRDLFAVLAHTRRMPGCGGKVGVVGYCLGGKLAYLMATRSDVECSVSYYGSGIEFMLDEACDVRAPLLLHISEQDCLMPVETQAKILKSVLCNDYIVPYVYPDIGHAFAREGSKFYNAEASALASKRTDAFLEQVLHT